MIGEVGTFPYHSRVGDEVRPSEPVDLDAVLAQIARLLRSEEPHR